MSRATRLDLSPDSDHMGLSFEESNRAALRQLSRQEEQPGAHARFGWPLVLSILVMLLVVNAPALYRYLVGA